MSKCVKCGGGSFRVVENTPMGSAFKMMFVECASCGAVAGVMDYYAAGSIAKAMGSVVLQIADKLGIYVDTGTRNMLK